MAEVPATILELETIKGNPNAQAIFALPGSKGVSGIVQSDITINGQAMFNNPFESGEDLSKKLTTTIAGLAGVAKRAGAYSKEIPSLLYTPALFAIPANPAIVVVNFLVKSSPISNGL